MPDDAKTLGRMLRELGEGLDGFRDQPMRLVKRVVRGVGGEPDRLELVILSLDAPLPEGHEVVLDAPAVGTTPGPTPDHVNLYYNGKPVASCSSPTDALFWTDSSIEKFVYGYYEQVRVFPREYKVMRNQLEHPAKRALILAVRHDHPSRPETIATDDSISAFKLLVLDDELMALNGGKSWFSPFQFESIYESRFSPKSESNNS